jgi:hypothetical protein
LRLKARNFFAANDTLYCFKFVFFAAYETLYTYYFKGIFWNMSRGRGMGWEGYFVMSGERELAREMSWSAADPK